MSHGLNRNCFLFFPDTYSSQIRYNGSLNVASLKAVTCTGGFIAENPFRSLIGRQLELLRRALPGTSGRAQKSREGGGGGKGKTSLFSRLPPRSSRVAFLSTTALPAPSRRVLSKMTATKREHRVFSPKKLQRLQADYFKRICASVACVGEAVLRACEPEPRAASLFLRAPIDSRPKKYKLGVMP